ncbi:hypothetical protein [Rhizobium binae]|uniref:hypothetical protein n=1 Tax=Rhizobium binae TaxID=1138190 RepID=UPI001C837BBB|nr:hypothetical protein [Rhizobium binae]MBX4944608.1 hypothetical protein [Rhizobium binae]MBX4980639.1 hypothetical protein [Rhizobium binae]
MPFKRKLPDTATLAAHLDAGMTVDHIAETYDCRVEAVRRKLQHLGLMAVRPKGIPLDMAGKGPGPVSRSKRGVFLHPDRITFMRDTAGPEGGLEVRPMSLPRIGMYVAALAARNVNFKEAGNG